jgi:hypothetical protein
VNPPLRYLSMNKMDERAEHGAPPDPAMMEKMGALIGEITAAGVLESTNGLASTKLGARIRFSAGKHVVTDGPFTESKELVAGFAILKLPSLAAAIEWGIRFGHIVKVNEVEIRQIPEWA